MSSSESEERAAPDGGQVSFTSLAAVSRGRGFLRACGITPSQRRGPGSGTHAACPTPVDVTSAVRPVVGHRVQGVHLTGAVPGRVAGARARALLHGAAL